MKFKKRIIPKIRFINYHKAVSASKGIWNKWFCIERWWGGSIVNVRAKHYCLSFDFRKNWLSDMKGDVAE
jgi:hypothetical protein